MEATGTPCKLIVKVNKAENLVPVNGESADPFLSVQIKDDGEAPIKTKTVDGSINPVWDCTFEMHVNDWNTAVLLVNVCDEDINNDEKMIDELEFPLNQWPVGSHHDFEENVKLGDKDAGKLYLGFDVVEEAPEFLEKRERDIQYIKELQKEADDAKKQLEMDEAELEKKSKEPEPEPAPEQTPEPANGMDEKQFSLGEYSTTYSTDFSGYSECSRSLSGMRSSDEKFHHAHLRDENAHPNVQNRDVKLGSKPEKVAETIQGTIIKAEGIPKTDHNGSDTYVVLTVVPNSGKGKNADKVKTEIQHNTQDPVWNKDFEFPFANENDALRVEIYQHHKILGDKLIACCEIFLKDLKVNQPIQQAFPLEKPPKAPRVVKKVKEFGTITLSLNHHIQYQ